MNTILKNPMQTTAILLLASLAGVLFFLAARDFDRRSKIEKAEADLKVLEQAVETYYTTYKFYPECLEILAEPHAVTKAPPILQEKSVLIDPWGREYQYESLMRHGREPLIYSMGPDPNDSNMRITNWDKK